MMVPMLAVLLLLLSMHVLLQDFCNGFITLVILRSCGLRQLIEAAKCASCGYYVAFCCGNHRFSIYGLFR